MENCIGATHRAVLAAKALRGLKIGRGAPRLTEVQEQRLAFFRNAFEHADERLQGTTKNKNIPAFAAVDPYSIKLANTATVIGSHVLTYKELVSAMTKCHRAIEVIRGEPTPDPSPNFPNAQLRTVDPRYPKKGGPITTTVTDYFKQIARLGVSHA
jgi:hypothetical protein